MSTDFSAAAVIGVEVPVHKLTREELVRGCQHTDASGAYCPVCGKQTWLTRHVFIDAYHEWDREQDGPTLAGLPAFFGHERERLFVGTMVIAEGESGEDVGLHSLADKNLDTLFRLRAELREKLTSLDLWDESKFGLYCIIRAD